MSRRTSGTTRSTRRASLLFAGGFALIAVGATILVILLNRPPSTTPGGASGPLPVGVPPPDAQDITSTDDILRQSQRGSLTFADRENRERTAGTLEWANLKPVGRGVYSAEMPRAWIHLADGRSILLTATAATLLMPRQNEQPDSGSFTGDVVLRMFEDANGPVDESITIPALLLHAQALEFDARVGQVSIPESVVASTARIEFRGSGLRIVWNETENRPDLIDVVRGDSIRITRVESPTPAAPPAPSASPTGAAASDSGMPSVPSNVVLYRAAFSDHILLRQRARSIAAPRLDILARTINNALPQDAIAEVSIGAAPQSERANASASTPSDPDPQPGESAPATSLAKHRPDDVILTWRGPLVVSTVKAAPPELATDHVYARFNQDGAEHVSIQDEDSRVTVSAGLVDYAATTARIIINAASGAPAVTLLQQDRGSLITGRIEADLRTGRALLPGAGTIAAFGHNHLPDDRQLTWRRDAEIFFATDAGTASSLRSAQFNGNVAARDGVSTLDAPSILAEFESGAVNPNTIKRIVATARDPADPATTSGRVTADSLDDGRLDADELEITFSKVAPDETTEDPTPEHLSARGNVVGRQRGSLLASNALDADLARDSDTGEVYADNVVATGNARFEQDDGTMATAEEIRARPRDQSAVLIGSLNPGRAPASISRAQTRAGIGAGGSATILSAQLSLDGSTGELFAFGPGSFRQTSEVAGEPDRLLATWTRSMTFNDSIEGGGGRLEAVGLVEAVSRPDPRTVETAKGERVELWFDRESTETRSTASEIVMMPEASRIPAQPNTATSGDDRTLRRAEIYSAAYELGEGGQALVETVQYADAPVNPTGAAPEPLQFARLTGDRIFADAREQTLESPGAGTAAFFDGVEDSTAFQQTAAPTIASSGASFFRWVGGMRYTGNDSTIAINDEVRLIHRPSDGGDMMTIDCRAMKAVITPPSLPATPVSTEQTTASGFASLRGSTLQSASADGNVVAVSRAAAGMKQLLAGHLHLDAIARIATATADAGRFVTLIDPSRATPLNAERIEWNMSTDRIEAAGAAPVVVPR